MRPAQEDGAGAVQAVYLLQAGALRHGDHDQGGQAHVGKGTARGLGHPGRGHPRAPGDAQPGADLAPPGDSGLRADPHRGQGDPAAPPGLRCLQRRLRRRPDGRARAPVPRGPAGDAGADDVHQQHPQPGQRQAHHRALPRHRSRSLLPDLGARRRARRGHGLYRCGRDRAGPASRGGLLARQGRGALPHRGRRGQTPHRPRENHARAYVAFGDSAAQFQRSVRSDQLPSDQEGGDQRHRHGLSPLRAEGDRHFRRPLHGHGLRLCLPGGSVVRQGRSGRARRQGIPGQGDGAESQGVRAAVPGWPDHQGREVQQGGRRLVPLHRPGGR